jgi:hypothetical protein
MKSAAGVFLGLIVLTLATDRKNGAGVSNAAAFRLSTSAPALPPDPFTPPSALPMTISPVVPSPAGQTTANVDRVWPIDSVFDLPGILPTPVELYQEKKPIPGRPSSSDSYQTWLNWFEEAIYRYQWNYRLDVEKARELKLPLPDWNPPFTEDDKQAILAGAQTVSPSEFGSRQWSDAEIQAYADKWGLSFLSAKTAISQGMFQG